jgi:hypothetical protein
MESLETKIERLPPELQKEVEDFVDFLAAKHRPAGPAPASAPSLQPPIHEEASPIPFAIPETDTPLAITPRETGGENREVPPAGPIIFTEEMKHPGRDEWLTRNYLDYGAFEEGSEEKPRHQTRAIRKSRQARPPKVSQGPKILDWIE